MRIGRAAVAAGLAGLVALAAVPVLAGGLTGGDAPSRIPVPARVFTATFEDMGQTTVPASRVTFAGEVFVFGQFGAGQVTVPFEKISEVVVEKAKDDLHRTLVVRLRDGSEPVRIIVDDDAVWWGRTRFGNYKIEVRDLARVRGFTAEKPEE